MKSNKKVYFLIFFTYPANIDIFLKCSSHVWSALAKCTLIRVLGWPPPPITRFGKRSGLPAPSSVSGRRQSFHPAKSPDLVSACFFLFVTLKKELAGLTFSLDEFKTRCGGGGGEVPRTLIKDNCAGTYYCRGGCTTAKSVFALGLICKKKKIFIKKYLLLLHFRFICLLYFVLKLTVVRRALSL